MTDVPGPTEAEPVRLSGAEAVAGDDGLPHDRPKSIGRRIVSGFLSYGVIALVIYYLLNELAGAETTEAAFAAITAPQVVIICLLGVVNLMTNWPPLTAALPGLRVREAGVTNTAGAALSNTVPEGGAVATGLNFAMLRSWGFALSDITSQVVVTGTWSQMMKYLLLALALVAAVAQGWGPDGTVWVALILSVLWIAAAVLLGMILRSVALAERVGRWADRVLRRLARLVRRSHVPDLAAETPRFRALMVSLLAVCGRRLTVAMLVSQLTVVAVLGIACRMQGLDRSEISWAVIMVAWGGATLASLVIPVPGGIGVAEVVLTAILGYGLPESDQAAVLAAVILYRIATFLVPIPIGLVSYLYWRKSTAWRCPVDSKRLQLAGAPTG